MHAHRLGLYAWCVLAVALVTLAAQQNWHVRSDILGLLPEPERRLDLASASERFGDAFRRAVLVSVDLPTGMSLEDIGARAGELKSRLEHAQHVAFPDPYVVPPIWRDARYHLLSDDLRAGLRLDPDRRIQEASERLYGIGGLTAAADPLVDPLGLSDDYLRSHLPTGYEPAAPGILFGQTRSGAFLFAQVVQTGGAFDAGIADALLAELSGWRSWARGFGGDLKVGGLPVFSAHAASRAMFEVSTFGAASLSLIVLLLILSFRSARPLLATLTVIGSALAAAFVLTHAIFGEVHVLTLVFGASLIGISVDYVFHYLCESTQVPGPNALAEVLPGITLAMVSSAAAFASFAFTPFPGLRQIALFAAGGLLVAWLTVVGVVPLMVGTLALRPRWPAWAAAWVAGWPHVPNAALRIGLLLLGVLVVLGVFRIEPNDDVQLLQSSPPAVVEDDARTRALAPLSRASQFFVVRASSPERLLNLEAKLIASIQGLGIDPGRFFALSEAYPSLEQQTKDHAAFVETMVASGRLERWRAEVGLPGDGFAQALAASAPLGLEDWIAGAPPHLAGLWLGCGETGCASIVGLERIENADEKDRLATLAALDGVDWVDQVAEISRILGDYRRWALFVLGIVFALVGAALMRFFGWAGGLRVLAVPALAVGVAIVGASILGYPFSLFTLLGVLLVTGIGIDYAIFYRLHGRGRSTTAVAITLSAATTLIAFGLLSFSQTTVVHTFGVVVFAGILTAYALAPLALAEPGSGGGNAPRRRAVRGND